MERDKNHKVVERFVGNKENLEGYGAVSSKNNSLYSYNAKIAYWENGQLFINTGWDGYSKTTSKHFKFLLDAIEDYNVDYVDTGKPKGKSDKHSRF